MNTPPPDDDAVSFDPVRLPATAEEAPSPSFEAMTRVRNAVLREVVGSDVDAQSAGDLAPVFAPDPDEIRHLWLIRRGGEVIGRVGVDIPQIEGSRTAFWFLDILAAHHGAGIGTHAHEELIEPTARRHGRTVLQAWAQHAEEDGERLHSPAGLGSIPRDHAARFGLRNGYTLAQVERRSEFDLTTGLPRVEELYAEAQAAAEGYRIVQWEVPTPAEYAEDYAWLKSRMNTDAPAADLEWDEEPWDAERVARHDALLVRGDGGRALVTAAQHVASGRLVAFNELTIQSDPAGATSQEDTLVLKEHRGHRLGMLVKCAGLRAWPAIAPRSTRVITYNAEENRPMLDVNEAIGFVPVAYEGAWKKVLE